MTIPHTPPRPAAAAAAEHPRPVGTGLAPNPDSFFLSPGTESTRTGEVPERKGQVKTFSPGTESTRIRIRPRTKNGSKNRNPKEQAAFQESEARVDGALLSLAIDIDTLIAAAERHVCDGECAPPENPCLIGGALARARGALTATPGIIKTHAELMACLLALVAVIEETAGPAPKKVRDILRRAGAALDLIGDPTTTPTPKGPRR